ncbi:MAG: lipopolysaccharide assembly protein LapA domain-containing protein [Nocardioides sp.]|nr:lipopolysaccharide assembly protein LapA domain-containing protein [Nocardioides sp.]
MTETPDDARDQLPGQLPARADGEDPLRGSRTSGFWAAVVGLGVVLLLLIIFIAQNTRKTTVSFLAWDGQVPVAVALLIAALAGLFLAGLAGSLRILQLRRRVRHTRR